MFEVYKKVNNKRLLETLAKMKITTSNALDLNLITSFKKKYYINQKYIAFFTRS